MNAKHLVDGRIVSSSGPAAEGDRRFRDAWALDAGAVIQVNMTKAREIHREVLRRERAPRLAALDVEYQRALEADDTARQSEIVTTKQRLRDITGHALIERASDCDELSRLSLDYLMGLSGQ
ncbi:MAG: hypothetical protein ACTS10_10930 [Kiloniellales bacterium]